VEALKSYRDGLAIRDRLAASDRSNTEWQRDLSVSYNKIGDVLKVQGDLAGALSAYRDSLVLQAAERHSFMIVEDDIFCDLQMKTTPRLATLDQLGRVIYVRRFSKTLSGSLRVGFIACALPARRRLARPGRGLPARRYYVSAGRCFPSAPRTLGIDAL
jgi:hypothetical protein